MQLCSEQEKRVTELYSGLMPKAEAQQILAKEFGVTTRTIRNYAKKLGLVNGQANMTEAGKILIYDIETSRVTAKVWGTGKQYVSVSQLKSDTTIISIAWKWLGENEVKYLTWDMKTHSDREMVREFLKEYNKAQMIVGQNNNSFDNKLVQARAAKYGFFINQNLTSFDIMRHAKTKFRLASYSMAYMAKYFGVTMKQSHEGIHMWDMIEEGNAEEQAEYMKKMVDYNVGDIVTTEELFIRMRPYFKQVTHIGVSQGKAGWTCPFTGSSNVKLSDTSITASGTVQRWMFCEESGAQYKISNKNYLSFLEFNQEV